MSENSALSSREHGETPEEQELIAAKLMGRWRSGAPLTLCPEKDDPELGADLHRANDFNYAKEDPHGYAVPLGLAHAANESARHGSEHEPPAHDPPRSDLRTAAARRPEPTTAGSAASRPSSSARALSGNSSLRRTSGPTTRTSTSLATSATRSSAITTRERSNTRFPSGRFARRSSACPPSPPSAAAPTSSCPASRHSTISQVSARLHERRIPRDSKEPAHDQSSAHLQPVACRPARPTAKGGSASTGPGAIHGRCSVTRR